MNTCIGVLTTASRVQGLLKARPGAAGSEGDETMKAWIKQRYHAPSDDLDQPVDSIELRLPATGRDSNPSTPVTDEDARSSVLSHDRKTRPVPVYRLGW